MTNTLDPNPSYGSLKTVLTVFFLKCHLVIIYIPAETGTAVINPKVTNILYVTAALN